MRIAKNWDSRWAWWQSTVTSPDGAQPDERRNACDYDKCNGIHLDDGMEKFVVQKVTFEGIRSIMSCTGFGISISLIGGITQGLSSDTPHSAQQRKPALIKQSMNSAAMCP